MPSIITLINDATPYVGIGIKLIDSNSDVTIMPVAQFSCTVSSGGNLTISQMGKPLTKWSGLTFSDVDINGSIFGVVEDFITAIGTLIYGVPI